MVALTVENMLEQADRLPPAERLRLATRLIEGVRQEMPSKTLKPLKWRDICGMLPYPAFSEDAQRYITRTRREATHKREDGVDIWYIQELMGHDSILTTQRYTHVTKRTIGRIKSPLDNISL